MKKLFTSILTACAIMASATAALAAGTVTDVRLETAAALTDIALDETMYSISAVTGGVSINGFSSTYLSALETEEKQNLAIVIPAVYKGENVVAVGDGAFYNIFGYKVTSIDLSGAVKLRTIGKNAFMGVLTTAGTGALVIPDGVISIGSQAFSGCSGFSGDLILPDSIESIADSAFMSCGGLNGTLRLPKNEKYTTIADQLFSGCKFTGELRIPKNIAVIGAKAFRDTAFTGTLTIPQTVTSLGDTAFSGCTGFTGNLSVPDNITYIGSQTFKDCTGFSGVLSLPDTLAYLGKGAFSSTKFQVAYLPDNENLTFNTSGNSPFWGTSTPVVCPSKELYAKFYEIYPADSYKKLLTYVVTITFDGRNDLEPLERMYNKAMNYVKDPQTKLWAVDSLFQLPELTGEVTPGYQTAWSFQENGAAVSGNTVVTGESNVLYATISLMDPIIDQVQETTLQKVYDGTPIQMEIRPEHPLAGSEVQLYYDWYDGSQRIQWGQSNTYDLTSVSDSRDGYKYYYVRVYAYKKGESQYYYRSDPYYFHVTITPAEPAVSPVCRSNEMIVGSELPPLALTAGDTPGTIAWDAGQTITEGVHEYTWTFTSSDPNYGNAVGKIQLTGMIQPCYVKGYDRTAQIIKVVSDKAQSGVIMLLEYDAMGKLISSVVKEKVEVTAGETSIDVSGLGFQPGTGNWCRVMLWKDLTSIDPLCEDKDV